MLFKISNLNADSNIIQFNHVSTKNGLSNSDINSIVQDNQGFIWFATEYGLNRYDGYEIKVYRCIPGDSSSIQDNSVNCVFIDHEGVLWVGTSHGGLSRYISNIDAFETFQYKKDNPKSISYNYITHITEDEFNNLWIATLGGLNRFDRKTQSFIKYKSGTNSLSSDNLRTLMPDGKGNLIIGYERNGFAILNIGTNTIKNYPFPTSLYDYVADNAINSILIRENEYWFATRLMGIIIYNCLNKTFTKLNITGIDKRTNYLTEDFDKTIWIATKNGLYNYNPQSKKTASFFQKDCDVYSLSNNSVSCLYIDRQKILWAGCMQGGVNFANKKNAFVTYKKSVCNSRSLSQQSVSSVFVDSHNNLWVGYFDNGVEIIKPNTLEKTYYYNLPTAGGQLVTGTVFCFFEDSKKNIWIGTYQNGLFRYDAQRKLFVNYNKLHNKLTGNDVRSITEDKQGNLWLAIHGGGVDKFDPVNNVFENFRFGKANFGTSPASDWVFKVFTDRFGVLWIGSITGLSMFDSNTSKFENFSHTKQGYKNEGFDVIWTLNEDKKNHLWLGSSMGLSIFDTKTKKFLKVLTKYDGLPSDAIASIEVVNDSNIWIGTYSGLVKYNPFKKGFKTYTLSEESSSDRYFINASCKNNGKMYFGGVSGLLEFIQDSIKDYNFVPPVVITDFKLFNKSLNLFDYNILSQNISHTKKIKLKYSQNVITINYVGLNYIESEKNQYAYKLEGFDKDWNYVDQKREATYTNLSPGTYVFNVIASNNDGLWNKVGAKIEIEVLPPFWKTIWAFIIYTIIIISALFLYKKAIQNREELKRKIAFEHMEAEKQIEMNNQRIRFFTNISHEFRTSLSLIIGPTEKMLEANSSLTENMKSQAKTIKNNAQRLLRLINQLLDLRKIEAGNMKLYPTLGDIVSFCKEISNTFEFNASQKKINFTFESSEKEIYTFFDADKIEKIIYNLLSNAFKYTPNNGSVSLKISLIDEVNQSGNFCIEVSDTGIGIPQESLTKIFERFYQVDSTSKIVSEGTGIGLSLVKELVEMHNGFIEAVSNKNNEGEKLSGTTIRIKIPLEIKHINDIEVEDPGNEKAETNYSENQPDAIKPQSVKNKTILLVEDNAELRSYIKSILDESYKITEAENGMIGVKIALDNNFDLIISDIMMPGMQGTELCKLLKTDSRTSHIPIILLTALNSIENKIFGYNIGADEYITKPFNSDLLKSRISNLIESREIMRNLFSKYVNIEPKEIAITSLDEKFLQKAIETVEKYIDEPLFDIEKFTMEMAVSRTLLHNKLKALTNLSATEFIKTIRLKRAAQLLKKGQLGVSEVSIMVGFNSRNYFTKCFSEHFGVSPSEYEKN